MILMLPQNVLAHLCTLVVLSNDTKAINIAREFVRPTCAGGRCQRFSATEFSAWHDGVGIAATGTIRRDDGVERSVRVLVVEPSDLVRVLSEGNALHLQSGVAEIGYTFTPGKMSPRPTHSFHTCQIGRRLSSPNSINSVLHQMFTGGTSN